MNRFYVVKVCLILTAIFYGSFLKAQETPVLNDVFIEVHQDNDGIFDENMFIDAFADGDGDPLEKVKFEVLPRNGFLRTDLGGVKVNDEILVNDLKNLKFIPNRKYAGMDTFYWNGFANNEYSEKSARVIVQITGNNPPTITGFKKSVVQMEVMYFTREDFENVFNDNDEDDLQAVRIDSMPQHGELWVRNYHVNKGDEILSADLNDFRYIPNQEFVGVDTLFFNARDSEDFSNVSVKALLEVNEPTSLNENKTNLLKVFPNPVTSGKITISRAEGIENYEILDVTGKVIKIDNFNSAEESIRINTGTMKPGFYLLRVGGKNGIVTKSIILR